MDRLPSVLELLQQPTIIAAGADSNASGINATTYGDSSVASGVNSSAYGFLAMPLGTIQSALAA